MRVLTWREAIIYLKNIGPVEFTDRYGGRTPSWLRGCFGDCEASGFYSENNPDEWPPDARPLGQPEDDGTPDDGRRFVKCQRCNGTGRVSWCVSIARVPQWVARGVKGTWQLSRPDHSPLDFTHRQRWWLAFKCNFVYDILRIRN